MRISRTRTARRLSALGLAGVVAFTLSACGGNGTEASDGEKPAGVVALTQETFAQAIGDSQEAMKSAHIEMTYAGGAFEQAGLAGSPILADVNLAGETPEMHMTMSMQGMDVEMILTEGNAYIGMGELMDGKFIHLNEEELAADPDFASLADSINADFGAQARSFAKGVKSFEKSGTEVVDGTELTLYTLKVDPAKISSDALDLEPEVLAQIGEMTVVYGLDAQNIPRKADVTMSIAGQEMTMATTISKVNEPVTITAPAEDQTIPYSQIAG